MSAEDKTHIKYLSFRNNIRAERAVGLKLNRLLNGKTKYEQLEDLNLMDKAKYNRQKGCVGKLLMIAKAKGSSVFSGVEQGSGKHKENVFVCYKPNMVQEAQIWIRKVYKKVLL